MHLHQTRVSLKTTTFPHPPPKPQLKKLGDELQLESAFKSAWDMAASQIINPSASPDDLELAEIEPADAWQQLQDSSGVAAGSSQAIHEATRFALSRGAPAFQQKLLPCPEGCLLDLDVPFQKVCLPFPRQMFVH